MLVYANSFVFEPAGGAGQIIHELAKWVGNRAKSYVDADRLTEGIRELRLKDGSTLNSRATVDIANQAEFPYFFCAQLSHRDETVSGRKWVTEVGLRQESANRPIECSVLLRTDEVSALVTDHIRVTRPKLVQRLVDTCRPIGETPGLTVKRLDQESALAFVREVERDERRHPIVLISCARDGNYPVAPERLRSVLVGLADVVDVPVSVDTFSLEQTVGRRYIAFGGAINIVFPPRMGDRGRFCETVLLRQEQLANIRADGRGPESEVLATITHRTNLPYSWRHISPEIVRHAVLRGQLAHALARAKSSNHSDTLAEYTALLEAADEELQKKEDDLARMRDAYEVKEHEARKLKADIDGLKHALSGRQASDDEHAGTLADSLMPLRDSIAAVLSGNPSLQQGLELISTLYPDRVVVLDTALSSARDSDRGGFRIGARAHEVLQKLVTDYWDVLADGNSDQQAKAVFGQNAYAANEASALSNEGKRRRTFSYRGRDFVMERHLKLGVKDSVAETLRVHFEWIAGENRIVIGHCGKHLDF